MGIEVGSESSHFPIYCTLVLANKLFTALRLLFSGETKPKEDPKAHFRGCSNIITKLELIQRMDLLTACGLDIRSSAATDALEIGSYCAALFATGFKAFLADLAWQGTRPAPITDLLQGLGWK